MLGFGIVHFLAGRARWAVGKFLGGGNLHDTHITLTLLVLALGVAKLGKSGVGGEFHANPGTGMNVNL